jgi:hypothetical protein
MRRGEMKVSVHKPSFVLSGLFLVSAIALWILFVGGTRRDEMLVGLGVAFLTAAFVYQVWRMGTLHIAFHMSDVIQGWRVPGYVLRDTCVIALVLLRDLIGAASTDSLYRVSEFKTVRPNSRKAARQVLITLYTTMSPNSIVIGMDPNRGRILFHQLQRSSITKMGVALGVKPGVQEP